MSPESDHALRDLAEAAGIATTWRDVHGEERQVGPDTIRAVLAALGLPLGAEAARAALAAMAERLPSLITLTCGPDGAAVPGTLPGHRFRLDFEGGGHAE